MEDRHSVWQWLDGRLRHVDGLKVSSWNDGDVYFDGWIGAAGEPEYRLIRELRAFGDDVDVDFVDVQGYAKLRVSVFHGDMSDDQLWELIDVVKQYRCDKGYRCVEFSDAATDGE